MCGRYYIELDGASDVLRRIVEQAEQRVGQMELGEMCPGKVCPVVDARGTREMVWGFKAPGGKRLVINARSETAAERAMFRQSVMSRRLVIPASGYYEWMKRQDGSKQKYAFSRDGEALFMAGLWRQEPGEEMPRFVVLTTDAAPAIREIHDRMPVLLRESQLRAWLRDDGATQDILRDVELRVRFGAV